MSKVLVYSVTPPENTGMASYAVNIFKNNNFIIITKPKNVYAFLRCLFWEKKVNKNVFSYTFENDIKNNFDVVSKVFVIGNSWHHFFALEKAIETKGEENRYLSLGENLIISLLIDYFKLDNTDKIKKFIKEYYNKDIVIENNDINSTLRKEGIYGLRIITELTGIKKFFVYTQSAIEYFKKEFSDKELADIEINVISIPVPDLKSNYKIKKLYKKRDFILIGSFGICHSLKSTDDIIKAVNLINLKGLKAKLLLAGYNSRKYIKSLKINKDNIITVNNPNYEELYSLMNSVDIAVQLRPFPHGEVSGCILELIALYKKIITTKNFVPYCIKDFCREVEPGVLPQKLANVIIEEVNNQNNLKNYKKIKNLNFTNCGAEIYDKLKQKEKNNEYSLCS